MVDGSPKICVLRKNTEGLSTVQYADILRNKLPNSTINHARTPKQEISYIKDADVATGVIYNESLLSAADNLKLFVLATSGYNHIPLDSMVDQGITVANAAGIHAPGIAEQVIGYCLLFARSIVEGIERKRNREWRHYQAAEFRGSTVTIVGLGSIGTAIAARLDGFGVETIGVRYTPEKGGPTDEVVGFEPEAFHEALSRTDYLVLSTPLSETTERLIGPEEFDTLPPHARLINVSRGRVVDTDALVGAIQNHDVAGAALDVTDPEPLPPDSPLWTLENVIVTPHMGGHTPEHWNRLADIVATNVERLREGETDELVNVVGSPAGGGPCG